MKEACLNRPDGTLIQAEEFSRLLAPDWRAQGIQFFCPGCKDVVHPYGVYSPRPETPRRFDHQNIDQDCAPFHDCILANRGNSPVLPPPLGWQFELAERRKKAFCEPSTGYALRTYAACHYLCGARNLPVETFLALVHLSNKHNIWAYKGLEP